MATMSRNVFDRKELNRIAQELGLPSNEPNVSAVVTGAMGQVIEEAAEVFESAREAVAVTVKKRGLPVAVVAAYFLGIATAVVIRYL